MFLCRNCSFFVFDTFLVFTNVRALTNCTESGCEVKAPVVAMPTVCFSGALRLWQERAPSHVPMLVLPACASTTERDEREQCDVFAFFVCVCVCVCLCVCVCVISCW